MPLSCEETDSLLLDFADGDLDDSQSDDVRRHVRGCPECAARLRALRDIVGAMSAARSMADRHVDSATVQLTASNDTRPASAPPAAGVPALKDYEILGEIGRGGMGVVYRARQISLNRVVALKVLGSAITASESAVTRFRKEAQAAARLHHTNIVPVYAQGQEGDCFYYTMELVDGQPLSKVLQEAPSLVGGAIRTTPGDEVPDAALEAHASITLSRAMPRKTRDYKRIASMLAGVADGLHHAHDQGIIHRDIKPQNLLLGRDGQLHITDFGLARLLDEPGVTLSSEMVGTPAYMSPEQINGQPISRASDVFSLGGVMYEMLVHKRAFDGRTYDQVIQNVLRTEPRRPRKIDAHVPVDLETICLRALEKDSGRRFATTGEFARDLRRYAEDFPIASRRIGPIGRAARWVRRHPARTAAIAATALVLAIAPFAIVKARALRIERAKASINSAFDTLVDDYRNYEVARQQLRPGLASGIDSDRAHFVEAFADVRANARRAIEILAPLANRPDASADVHYLLAWAYSRRGLEAAAAGELERGSVAVEEPTFIGHFFRGMALSMTDPAEAAKAFEEGKKKRERFTQAMLMQARAYNWVLYYSRDIEKYKQARANLEVLIDLQKNKAYPRYLLATAHRVAAEAYFAASLIAASPKDADEMREVSETTYSLCLDAAKAAAECEPKSPRGFAARAEYYESRATVDGRMPRADREGFLRKSVAAWNEFDVPHMPPVPEAKSKSAAETGKPKNALRNLEEEAEPVNVLLNVDDRSERAEYEMRLLFWVGDFNKAQEWSAKRFSPDCGYDPKKDRYYPNETLFEVVLALAESDRESARKSFRAGVVRAGGDGEAHLVLRGIGELIQDDAATRELRDKSIEAPTSPGLTIAWMKAVLDYQAERVGWDELEKASRGGEADAMAIQNRMASAWFARGMKALAAAARDEALESFWNGSQQRDNEHYCFACKMLYFGLLDGRLPLPPQSKTDR